MNEKKEIENIKSQIDLENWYQSLLDDELCLIHGRNK